MDDYSAQLNRKQTVPWWPITAAVNVPVVQQFPRGTRVFWAPNHTEAIGTVAGDAPDKDGWILVAWDGIGTYKEEPKNLRPVPTQPR